MRLNLVGGIVAALIIVALIIAYGALFTVYQTRQALVVRLGQPVRVVTQPGSAWWSMRLRATASRSR
jgi:membrane protease subunit HflC